MHCSRGVNKFLIVVPGCPRPISHCNRPKERVYSSRYSCVNCQKESSHHHKSNKSERAAGLTSDEIARLWNPLYDLERKGAAKGPKSSQPVPERYGPDRRARGDSPCATCKSHHSIGLSGLTSQEFYRDRNLEDPRKYKAKEGGYRSRHELRYPPGYQHYEGYAGDCDYRENRCSDEDVLFAVCVPAAFERSHPQRNKFADRYHEMKSRGVENRGGRECKTSEARFSTDRGNRHSNPVGRKSTGTSRKEPKQFDGEGAGSHARRCLVVKNMYLKLF